MVQGAQGSIRAQLRADDRGDRAARDDFRAFAPDLVASPKTSLYRIYRDTRFSENKAPLKTHIAAVFPCRGLAKHQGAGLYLEVAPAWVWVGGGMYAPEPSQLQAVREHIAANVRRLRAVVESPAFRRRSARSTASSCSVCPAAFQRTMRRRVSEIPAVSRGPRVSGELRLEPPVLSGRPRRLPANRAADPLPQRAAVGRSRLKPTLKKFLTDPDDLDALVTELNAGAPRRGPTTNTPRGCAAGWSRSSHSRPAICCSSRARRRCSVSRVRSCRSPKDRSAARKSPTRSCPRCHLTRGERSARRASPTRRSGRRISAASASTCITSADAPRRRSAGCRRPCPGWPASACRPALRR